MSTATRTDTRSPAPHGADGHGLLPVQGARRLDHQPRGRVDFEGTPADLVGARSTLTGEHRAAYVGA